MQQLSCLLHCLINCQIQFPLLLNFTLSPSSSTCFAHSVIQIAFSLSLSHPLSSCVYVTPPSLLCLVVLFFLLCNIEINSSFSSYSLSLLFFALFISYHEKRPHPYTHTKLRVGREKRKTLVSLGSFFRVEYSRTDPPRIRLLLNQPVSRMSFRWIRTHIFSLSLPLFTSLPLLLLVCQKESSSSLKLHFASLSITFFEPLSGPSLKFAKEEERIHLLSSLSFSLFLLLDPRMYLSLSLSRSLFMSRMNDTSDGHFTHSLPSFYGTFHACSPVV